MRKRTLPVLFLMIGAGLGHAAPESSMPGEYALFLEARGEWEEAAAQHLADARASADPEVGSLALASALADLATNRLQCSPLGDQVAAELQRLRAVVWTRDKRVRLPGRALLWLDLQAAACRNDRPAARRLRAGEVAETVELAEVWTALGDLSRQERDLKAAAEEYALALNRRQNGVPATALRVRLAGALLRLGQLDESERLVEALNKNHQDPSRGPRRDVLMLWARLARLRGHAARAFSLLGQVASHMPEGERRWTTLLQQSEVAQEAGLASKGLGILHRLASQVGDSPSLTAARLDLAERLQNRGKTGGAPARRLLRRVLDSGNGADAARAMHRLVDSWITSGQPLRAFAELAVVIRSEDALLVALARDRFGALLPRYLEIFVERHDTPSTILLYRLAEGVWMLAPLDAMMFLHVGEAYNLLGLSRQALDLTVLAAEAAGGQQEKEPIRLLRARLLEQLDRDQEALEILLDPDQSECSRVAAAAVLASRTDAARQFVERFGHEDLSSCEAAVQKAAAGLMDGATKETASPPSAAGAA